MQEKALSFIALLAQDPKARESLYDLDFMLLTRFLGAENQKIQSLACSAFSYLYSHLAFCHSLSFFIRTLLASFALTNLFTTADWETRL